MKVFTIRHLGTNTFMPCRMFRTSGRGWSTWDPRDSAYSGFDKNPRIFFSERAARLAIVSWAQGIRVNEQFGTMFDEETRTVIKPVRGRDQFNLEIVEGEITWTL